MHEGHGRQTGRVGGVSQSPPLEMVVAVQFGSTEEVG